MYRGKHASKTKTPKKTLVLLTALFLIFTVTAGSTLAYLVTKTDSVVNTFQPSVMQGGIDEEFDGMTKTDVKVTNTGDVPAYVRAAIIINWVDDEGKVVTEPVVASDYDMSLNTSNWTKIGDYYYYTSVLAAKSETKDLIESCTVTATGKAKGYRLSVEILAQAVQSEPEQAVKDVWGVSSSQFID